MGMFMYAFKQTQFQLIKGVKLMSSTEVCLFVSYTMNYQKAFLWPQEILFC